MNYNNLYKTVTTALQELRAETVSGTASDFQKKLEAELNEVWLLLHPIVERSQTHIEPIQDTHTGLLKIRDEFLELSGISKAEFAEGYGCGVNYLSRQSSRDRGIDLEKLLPVLEKHGYTIKIDGNRKTWEAVPKL